MTRRLRDVVVVIVSSVAAFAVTASPAGAQQLVDAGKENGGGALAFVLFTVLVGLTFGLYPALRAARLVPIEAIHRE